MDKVLKPDRFDATPNSTDAAKQWRYCFITFENFLETLPQQELNKLRVLANHVSPKVYDLISEVDTYEEAVAILKTLYVKTPNEILAQHSLATQKQQPGESLDEFCQVTAAQYRETKRDAFISGIISSNVRQLLLENKILDLQTAFHQARALDTAQKSSEPYKLTFMPTTAVTGKTSEQSTLNDENEESKSAASSRIQKCFFCGFDLHPRSKCPA